MRCLKVVFRILRFKGRKLQTITVMFCILAMLMLFHAHTSSVPYREYPTRLLSFISSFSRLCACNTCLAKENAEDPWFINRFNQSVNPIITRSNMELTEDVDKWFNKLQSKTNSTFSASMKDLFQFIPDRERYRDAGPDRCRRCAVVGNSGNMNGTLYGPRIDANDIIIRLNKAPVKGFESDVGSRTTHRFMYPESAVDLEDSTHLVLVPFKALDLKWLASALTTGSITRTYVKVKSRIKANTNLIMVINPAFMKYVYEVWLDGSGRYPSTGFLALIFAIHICDEVTVFGFGADKFGNWHHYWVPAPKKAGFVSSVHNRNNEFKVSMQLMGNQKVTIFSGL